MLSQSPEKYYIVFISSTSDLSTYRTLARDAILDKSYIPVWMETFPSGPNPPKCKIDTSIRQSDAVLLIVGSRYGSIQPDEATSYVEWEYNLARECGKPVFPLVLNVLRRDAKSADFSRQEQFVDALQKNNHTGFFVDEKSFLEALHRTLDVIPNYVAADAGLIRLKASTEIIELKRKEVDASSRLLVASQQRIRELEARLNWARKSRQLGIEIAGAVAQLNSAKRSSTSPLEELNMNRLGQQNDSLRKLISVITSDWQDYPILVDIVAAKLGDLTDQLHGLIDPRGYLPRDLNELKTIIDRLFAPTLVKLQATSIHSRRSDLKPYNTYWDDPQLGPFFDRKNKDFLLSGGAVQRVYLCDSLVDAVGEPWFRDMALEQLRIGAQVKVAKIENDQLATYEDFGVYKHRTDEAVVSSYVLCAPRNLNAPGSPLRTSLISATDLNYETAFDRLWNSSPETLALVEHEHLTLPASRPTGEFGPARVNDMFSNCVLLRNMIRLDTREKLITGEERYPRKHEEKYSLILGRHILQQFPDTGCIRYFGDTHLNDASVIRNLQRQGFSATGFICEPELRIKNLWFNGIYYSDTWTDVLGYFERINSASLGRSTLAIFDLDQTVWAPKGVLEAPLTASRTAAMHSLIDRYVEGGRAEFAARTRQLVSSIYRIIKGIKFNVLTQDNEDYKAAISICLALSLYKDPNKQFSLLSNRLHDGELEWAVSEKVLRQYMVENGMSEFIGDVFAELDSPEVEAYASENGIRLSEVKADVRTIFRNMRSRIPTPYTAFREKEFEQAISRTGNGGESKSDRLVINKTIWDVATWLRDKNAKLFALSDRPDEATYRGAESLLDSPMTVYGRSIDNELARISHAGAGA